MFLTKVAEKNKTHILCSIMSTLSPQNHAIYVMWKNYAVGQATDDNMLHAHGWLDN
jgi:hypothetical protein